LISQQSLGLIRHADGVPSRRSREDLVSTKGKLRSLFLCFTLLAGALGGSPMRPEEIEELMHTMNQPKITYTIRTDAENGDDAK
jgi:hypothetical protein